MCIPGPQPQGSERSVHPWTSNARIPGSVHTWTSTARIRSQCVSLDLNRKDLIAECTGFDRSVHPWTSSARIPSQCAPLDLNRKDPIAVCTPRPQPQGSDRSVHPCRKALQLYKGKLCVQRQREAVVCRCRAFGSESLGTCIDRLS